jgi:hypothetical protein
MKDLAEPLKIIQESFICTVCLTLFVKKSGEGNFCFVGVKL